jgi:hypothetical protein
MTIGSLVKCAFQNVVGCALLDAVDGRHVPERAGNQDQGHIQAFPGDDLKRFHASPVGKVIVGKHDVRTVGA